MILDSLTDVELNEVVDDFIRLRNLNPSEVLSESKTIYKSRLEFADKCYDLSVCEFQGKLIFVSKGTDSTKISPVLIQFGEDGELLDLFYEEFLMSYNGDAKPYSYLESDCEKIYKLLFKRLENLD